MSVNQVSPSVASYLLQQTASNPQLETIVSGAMAAPNPAELLRTAGSQFSDQKDTAQLLNALADAYETDRSAFASAFAAQQSSSLDPIIAARPTRENLIEGLTIAVSNGWEFKSGGVPISPNRVVGALSVETEVLASQAGLRHLFDKPVRFSTAGDLAAWLAL